MGISGVWTLQGIGRKPLKIQVIFIWDVGHDQSCVCEGARRCSGSSGHREMRNPRRICCKRKRTQACLTEGSSKWREKGPPTMRDSIYEKWAQHKQKWKFNVLCLPDQQKQQETTENSGLKDVLNMAQRQKTWLGLDPRRWGIYFG